MNDKVFKDALIEILNLAKSNSELSGDAPDIRKWKSVYDIAREALKEMKYARLSEGATIFHDFSTYKWPASANGASDVSTVFEVHENGPGGGLKWVAREFGKMGLDENGKHQYRNGAILISASVAKKYLVPVKC